MDLNAPVQYLKGVGPAMAEKFARLGIYTLEDLLTHYPRRYVDFTQAYTIAGAPFGADCVVKARLFSKLGCTRLSGGRTLYRAQAADETGGLSLTWFNAPYTYDKLRLDEEYYFVGRVGGNFTRREMTAPAARTPQEVERQPLTAVYPQTEGLNSTFISKCVAMALDYVDLLEEPLPPALLQKYRLPTRAQAVRAIHRPQNMEEAAAARRRLIFEELFLLQCGVLLMRDRGARMTGAPMREVSLAPFWAALPFAPTGAQKRAAAELAADMTRPAPMNRLLQGDVGSGKTLVAAAGVYFAAQNGYQSALMAPTEILAVQHADNLQDLLAPFGIRVALVTGSMKAAEKRRALEAIAAGQADLVVGTHALLSSGVEFARLGLAVVDEQHRFGVRQRGLLAAKAQAPHLLVMSATPIPRTLGLLLYGDLDISILDELPPGRQPVKTWFITGKKREDMYGFLARQIAAGHQAYIVCPLIEDNPEDPSGEKKAAKTYLEQVAKPLLPGCRLGLLHGRMKPAEKTAVMDD
ncbi:MAG: ATP-dependent DNA helicase RecG, partial [Oscillospiraceae bacterium]|nr:ATP-dependent DNA helicase RecG [Oscillospiraceae bacterium]